MVELESRLQIDVTEGLAWTIPCEHGLTVTAAQLLHRVPCWGYVIKEADTPATERSETIRDAGMKPGEAMRLLREGGGPLDAVPTPSGKQVQLRDLLNPPVAGRKVVLLGDTCDSRAIAGAWRYVLRISWPSSRLPLMAVWAQRWRGEPTSCRMKRHSATIWLPKPTKLSTLQLAWLGRLPAK